MRILVIYDAIAVDVAEEQPQRHADRRQGVALVVTRTRYGDGDELSVASDSVETDAKVVSVALGRSHCCSPRRRMW